MPTKATKKRVTVSWTGGDSNVMKNQAKERKEIRAKKKGDGFEKYTNRLL